MAIDRSSELVKKLLGVFVEAQLPDGPDLHRWLQQACRTGELAKQIRVFAEAQPEPLSPELVRLVKVSEKGLTLSIPTKLFDHESQSPFETEVVLELNPWTGKFERMLTA